MGYDGDKTAKAGSTYIILRQTKRNKKLVRLAERNGLETAQWLRAAMTKCLAARLLAGG